MRSPYLPAAVYALCLVASLLAPAWWAHYALPLGLALLAFAFAVFLEKNRRYFSLLDLLFLHALIYQWAAPAIAYDFAHALHESANFMPVAADAYFGLAIPGTLALLLGGNLALALWQREEGPALLRVEEMLRSRPWLPFLLIALGFAGKLLYPLAPPGLRALAYFLFWFCLTGSFYLLFLQSKWKWAALGLLYLVFLRWALGSAQAGLPLWTLVFAALLLFFRHGTAPWKQALLYGGAFSLVMLALLVKFEFRAAMREAGMPKGLPTQIGIFARTIADGDALFSSYRLTRALDRFNQGFHVAQAMRHTPAQEPFARGETIRLALLGAMAPRMLWPDKPRAGGHAMYERFAGQKLNYSANLGPLGEAYVNFGVRGAVATMFVFGFLLAAAYAALGQLALRHWPVLLLWLPFIFSALLTLETDFATVLNHGVKSAIFTLLVISVLSAFAVQIKKLTAKTLRR
jgi:hypothetical protein